MSSFVQSLHEVFEALGRIHTKRMFGGHGVYHEGRMFGLVFQETLYLKSDAQTVGFFDALGLPAFTYQREGKTATLSYRQAPAELFEDRSEATLWGRRAWEAAVRSGTPPRAPKASTAKSPRRASRPLKKD